MCVYVCVCVCVSMCVCVHVHNTMIQTSCVLELYIRTQNIHTYIHTYIQTYHKPDLLCVQALQRHDLLYRLVKASCDSEDAQAQLMKEEAAKVSMRIVFMCICIHT